MTSIVGLECSLFQFLHLYSCKIDKENQDLLEIKSLSVVEHEKLLTQEGDKEAKQEGDSRTNPKPLDCTCKLTPTKKNIPVNQGLRKSQFVNQPFYCLFCGLDLFSWLQNSNLDLFVISAIIADTRKNDGNDAFLNHDFVKAINLYTEGIEVKCEDEDLNAKLYNNRASAHYHLGKVSFILTLRIVDIVLYSISNIPLSILHHGPFT